MCYIFLILFFVNKMPNCIIFDIALNKIAKNVENICHDFSFSVFSQLLVLFSYSP
jgi:hypothetical protein